MATTKSFTSLEQSKKLAKILPLESADMCYKCLGEDPYDIVMRPYIDWKEEYKGLLISGDANVFPCWSLAALLSVLPNNEHITTTLSRGGWKIEPVEYIDKWFCEYEDEVDEDSPCKNFSVLADNPIDACVAMIEKLNELKML